MDAYTGEKRTRAISYYGATAGIGSSLGLLVGGSLTSLVSWRAIGLSIMMDTSSQYHLQVGWMLGFTIVSTILVYVLIYQKGRMADLK